jgi:hypothetical protein
MTPAMDVATTSVSAHRKPIAPATVMKTTSSMIGSVNTASSSHFATFIGFSILGIMVGVAVPIV